MNFSEQMSLLFSCNVSPSETPQLNIGVTKSEPLTIAVPMTIFYSIIFMFGVWTLNLLNIFVMQASFMFWILYLIIKFKSNTKPLGMLTANILYHFTTDYVTYNALQVLFNGVSILTILMDAHMRVSAIRFYLLSLVISGIHYTHFIKDHKENWSHSLRI